MRRSWWLAVAAACVGLTKSKFQAKVASPCGEKAWVIDVGDSSDEEDFHHLKLCGGQLDDYSSQYFHEALAMPALCALGETAKTALIFGGADGGVATQLLKSPDMKKVTVVSQDVGLTQAAKKMSRGYEALTDKRLEIRRLVPQTWLESEEAKPHSYDIVILLEDMWHRTGEALKPNSRAYGPLAEFKSLIAPGGVLVVSGASIWNLPRAQSLFNEVSATFSDVYTASFTSILRQPSLELAFFAGSPNVLSPYFGWCRARRFNNVFYNEEIHGAMFVPSATVSRALGLKTPRAPNVSAVQERVAAGQLVDPWPPAPSGPAPHSQAFPAPDTEEEFRLHYEKTDFQVMEVFQYDGYRAMHLDEELQTTTLYGDFYHEAHVHPIMAALGRRARRALVLGAGDGGVATALLQYPLESVTQLEIDGTVIEVSKRFLKGMSRGYDDPRMELIVTDGIKWIKERASASDGTPDELFDICVFDTTDQPLASLWTEGFFAAVKKLMRPHGALIQNVGTHGDWMFKVPLLMKDVGFQQVRFVHVATPDYPSPYFLALATDTLDLFDVDWDYWSGLNITTVSYHPTLHNALFAIPTETAEEYWAELESQAAEQDAGRPQEEL